MISSRLLPLFLALGSLSALAQDNPFAQLVRPTDALTPEQERLAFHLPPQFAIQLVASEPDLRKPMNMQWDALGRLWITESREYPFALKDGSPGRDTVTIFSDFGADGKARKVEVFATGLNIPTGLYPFRSPDSQGKLTWKCIVWSIPNIWLLEDSDGDGKADRREVLVGPLGWERDTHGNLSSYRRGSDGWLYGTHGFNNQSTLKGKDGSQLQIQSGNTWRIRIDGSRVEGHTYGQVNPFGLTWDDRGNLYSADCHSSPVYQLLRGAFYPSFGKPHDGLGFAPQTILHSHGSTAICGPLYLSDPAWPAEYRDHLLIGNVQTSRLNHDLIEWHGASSKGKELPDFLSTEDPWFRPVDLSWGPDGALYVADFYNKIIGHYEVPLTHPGRDRERGRIWRIVYLGQSDQPPAPPAPPAALPEDLASLVLELASRNPTRRTLALNELCDRIGKPALSALNTAVNHPSNGLQKLNAIWALHRLGGLEESVLIQALADRDPLVRTHAIRTAGEIPKWSPPLTLAMRALTRDPDAIVQRCTTDALAIHPSNENIPVLLALLRLTPKEDDHLIHSTRIALRDQLLAFTPTDAATLEALPQPELTSLFEVMLAVPGENCAQLRLNLFEKADLIPSTVLSQQLSNLAKTLAADQLPKLIAISQRRLSASDTPLISATAIKDLTAAVGGRNPAAQSALQNWATEILSPLFALGGKEAGTAVDLANSLKLTHALPKIQKLLEDSQLNLEIRAKALNALVRLDPGSIAELGVQLNDSNVPTPIREKIAMAFGEAPSKETSAALVRAMKGASHSLQRVLATSLSSSSQGAQALVNACADGLAAPSLLLDQRLSDKLKAFKLAELTTKLEQLTAALPPLNIALDKLISERRQSFDSARPSVQHGSEIFIQTCAACHAIDGKGGTIGPQLDGIGGRGPSRLLEDILDPSRNVDKAFRLTMATKKDGSVITGMLRREEAGQIIFADLSGQELRVNASELSARKETETSLMPPNFGELLSVADLNDLIAYLLSKIPAK